MIKESKRKVQSRVDHTISRMHGSEEGVLRITIIQTYCKHRNSIFLRKVLGHTELLEAKMKPTYLKKKATFYSN